MQSNQLNDAMIGILRQPNQYVECHKFHGLTLIIRTYLLQTILKLRKWNISFEQISR